MDFCTHFDFQFLLPSTATVGYYVTYLTTKFTSSRSIRNYVSGICQLHKQLGLIPEALDSFPIMSLLCAGDMMMRIPLGLHPSPPYLASSVNKTVPPVIMSHKPSPDMRVCMVFVFLAMLRQSNLALPTHKLFDPSQHSCQGDVLEGLPGLLLVVECTNTL